MHEKESISGHAPPCEESMGALRAAEMHDLVKRATGAPCPCQAEATLQIA